MNTLIYNTRRLLAGDEGMTTIEYAMGALGAAALAGALYLVVSSGGVRDALEGIVTDALNKTPG
ncbi:Uncharacterised protein [Corynebacterium kutscheri]|uniref:DUF4244 domain-containing protein n=1 Tax=Corynebacterium kutscheri TaxID=35755 RepID=A0A0F6TCL2_9CORY|nr:DUF4244 domain-containing protein [Corynebacterium kutscheri]AKE40426.1 Protein of unknown function (DUF4244) [Corynebacterium kutscheri]VEH05227.1 Uncharacterised protein [Corynebacterium kutscheri]VEH10821.1 Uncharacterised protein [Corynebacterium kutscheri]VEH80700.1 Uncharacterised protein [Corynebacterium kutscheri]